MSRRAAQVMLAFIPKVLHSQLELVGYYLLNSTTVTFLSPLPICNVDLESGICQETVHEPENNIEGGKVSNMAAYLFAIKNVGDADTVDVVSY